jgi:predicted Zn-dependent protease
VNGKTSVIAALLASLSIGVAGYWLYDSRAEDQAKEAAYNLILASEKLKIAESLLHRQHPLKALQILSQDPLNHSKDPQIEQERLRLTLNAAALLGDESILKDLFTYNPTLFAHKEGAALMLAPRLLLLGDFAGFETLMEPFQSKPKRSPEWQLLKADSLALQHKPAEAIKLLEEMRASGEYESMRQLRLALLAENDHPKVAFERLTKAMKFQPANSDFHYFRAQLLENGSKADLAALELKQATEKSPENPFYRQELVDHYLRLGQFPKAYQSLQNFNVAISSSPLWIDAILLDRVYKPFATHFDGQYLPKDRETPLLRYLLTIDRSEYWDDAAIKPQPLVAKLAEQSPEVLWLHELAYLKKDEEKEALQFLVEHPLMERLYPQLYKGLQTLLTYRLTPAKIQQPAEDLKALLNAEAHPYLQSLALTPYNKELELLLTSDAAIPALFLANGWNEAAIRLNPLTAFPKDLPKWITFSYTQALKENRGPLAALEFAQAQPKSLQLDFLIAEILVQQGKGSEAEPTLKQLAKSPTKLGEQSTKLLADLYISRGQWGKTAEALSLNPAFAASLAGKERLAKVYIKLNKGTEAEAIYQTILNQSDEAKSYFAVKAFQNKDYKQALTLTKQLLQKHPYRQDLKTQLQKINEAVTRTN